MRRNETFLTYREIIASIILTLLRTVKSYGINAKEGKIYFVLLLAAASLCPQYILPWQGVGYIY